MFLAGVLLKLGSYGLLLFLPLIKFNVWLCLFLSLSLLGPLLCSWICVRQGDLKVLIAYSSVVHMSVVSLGFLSGSELGYTCGLIMILGHGLCSPYLFAVAYWLYLSNHSRLLTNLFCGGPVCIAVMIGIVSLNMGVPPCLNLWSEVLICLSTFHLFAFSFPSLLLIFFMGAVYNLYLYTSCQHSKFTNREIKLDNSRIFGYIQVMVLSYTAVLSLDNFHL